MSLNVRNLVKISGLILLTTYAVTLPQNTVSFTPTSTESFQRNIYKKQSHLFDTDGNSFFLTVIIYSKVTSKFVLWMSFFFLVSCTEKKKDQCKNQQLLVLCET